MPTRPWPVVAAALESFTFLAMFLADRGDRDLEDDELRVLLHAVHRVGRELGMAPRQAEQVGLAASQAFLDQRETMDHKELAAAVLHRADSLAQEPDLLPQMYQELVQIAAADGQTESGEGTILGILRSRWGLG